MGMSHVCGWVVLYLVVSWRVFVGRPRVVFGDSSACRVDMTMESSAETNSVVGSFLSEGMTHNVAELAPSHFS